MRTQDLQALFKKAKAFNIDGQMVARWALFLCILRGLPHPDKAVLEAYRTLDGVPLPLVEAAIAARTEEEALLLAKAYVGKRRGYANTHDEPSAEKMAETSMVHNEAANDGEIGYINILFGGGILQIYFRPFCMMHLSHYNLYFFSNVDDTGYLAGIDSVEMIYPTSRIPEALRQSASAGQRTTSASPQPQSQVDIDVEPINVGDPSRLGSAPTAQACLGDEEETDGPLPGPRIERQGNNVIGVVVPRSSPLVNQFERSYLINTHPSVFP